MFSSVIFDLDGTLLNTLEDLAAAANHTCTLMGWPTHSLDAYRFFVGNGIPKLVERFAPPAARTPAQLAAARRIFGEYYEAHKADRTAPYPGITSLLETLSAKGVSFGVVTNKDDGVARQMLRHYFGSAVAYAQGRTDALPAKPHPGTTLRLMECMGAAPASTLFVGDSDVDIFTAKNAGLASCGVLWGFRLRSELEQAGATYLVSDPAALLEVILR